MKDKIKDKLTKIIEFSKTNPKLTIVIMVSLALIIVSVVMIIPRRDNVKIDPSTFLIPEVTTSSTEEKAAYPTVDESLEYIKERYYDESAWKALGNNTFPVPVMR